MGYLELLLGSMLIALFPLIISLLQWSASSLTVGLSSENHRRAARKVTFLWMGILGFGVLWMLAGAGVVIASLNIGGVGSPSLILGGVIGSCGLVIALSCLPIVQLAGLFREVDDSVEQPQLLMKIYDTSSTIRTSGWCFFWLAMLILSLGTLPFGLIFLMSFVLCLAIIVWTNRRNREQHLLWVLVLAVRHRRDVAADVDALASGWSGRFARDLKALTQRLRDGESLGEALSHLPGLLPRFTRTELMAGHAAGQLEMALLDCGLQHRQWAKDRTASDSVSGAMTYLGILVSTMTLIVSFLCYFIVPKYKAIFSGFNTELPKATVLLIDVANLFTDYWFMTFPPFLCLIFLTLSGGAIDWRSLRIPLLDRFYPPFEGPLILRHLSRVIEKERPIAEGLFALSEFHHRRSVAEALAVCARETQAGGDCWEALLRHRFLAQRSMALISSAQRAGNLPWALRILAETQNQRRRYWLAIARQLAEPAVVIAMAVLVGFICVAMFLPISTLVNDQS